MLSHISNSHNYAAVNLSGRRIVLEKRVSDEAALGGILGAADQKELYFQNDLYYILLKYLLTDLVFIVQMIEMNDTGIYESSTYRQNMNKVCHFKVEHENLTTN